MSASQPTWISVAVRPRWLLALVAALAIAATCALLAGWQASRSIDQVVPAATQVDPKPIETVLKPGQPAPPFAVGTLVTAQGTLNQLGIWVVGNRTQRDGEPGFWVVGDYVTESGAHLIATLGFSPDAKTALAVAEKLRNSLQTQQLVTLSGRLSPGEGPLLTTGSVLGSLSIGQLLNDIGATNQNALAGEISIYPLFLLQPGHLAGSKLEDLTFAPLPTEAQINWLSAFYAVEWLVFCGFSVFLWWRLVRDAQLLEASQLAEAGAGQTNAEGKL